jgi:hypothetical protein
MTNASKYRESGDFARDVLRANRDLVPAPFGAFDALDQTGSIATPLMAGFALTTALLVLTAADTFTRWPNATLLLLTISVVSLVMSVQAAQWARSFRVHPSDVQNWWPDMTDGQRAMCVEEVHRHHEARVMWSAVQRWTYRTGLVALLAGLTVALVPAVPPPGAEPISNIRWLAVAVSGIGVATELAWFAMRSATTRWGSKIKRDGLIYRAFKVPASVDAPERTT